MNNAIYNPKQNRIMGYLGYTDEKPIVSTIVPHVSMDKLQYYNGICVTKLNMGITDSVIADNIG